jgi:hypothetical protein
MRRRIGATSVGVDGGLADGVGLAAAATDGRPEPLPDTVITGGLPAAGPGAGPGRPQGLAGLVLEADPRPGRRR